MGSQPPHNRGIFWRLLILIVPIVLLLNPSKIFGDNPWLIALLGTVIAFLQWLFPLQPASFQFPPMSDLQQFLHRYWLAAISTIVILMLICINLILLIKVSSQGNLDSPRAVTATQQTTSSSNVTQQPVLSGEPSITTNTTKLSDPQYILNTFCADLHTNLEAGYALLSPNRKRETSYQMFYDGWSKLDSCVPGKVQMANQITYKGIITWTTTSNDNPARSNITIVYETGSWRVDDWSSA
jgi:hypothetical protein